MTKAATQKKNVKNKEEKETEDMVREDGTILKDKKRSGKGETNSDGRCQKNVVPTLFGTLVPFL